MFLSHFVFIFLAVYQVQAQGFKYTAQADLCAQSYNGKPIASASLVTEADISRFSKKMRRRGYPALAAWEVNWEQHTQGIAPETYSQLRQCYERAFSEWKGRTFARNSVLAMSMEEAKQLTQGIMAYTRAEALKNTRVNQAAAAQHIMKVNPMLFAPTPSPELWEADFTLSVGFAPNIIKTRFDVSALDLIPLWNALKEDEDGNDVEKVKDFQKRLASIISWVRVAEFRNVRLWNVDNRAEYITELQKMYKQAEEMAKPLSTSESFSFKRFPADVQTAPAVFSNHVAQGSFTSPTDDELSSSTSPLNMIAGGASHISRPSPSSPSSLSSSFSSRSQSFSEAMSFITNRFRGPSQGNPSSDLDFSAASASSASASPTQHRGSSRAAAGKAPQRPALKSALRKHKHHSTSALAAAAAAAAASGSGSDSRVSRGGRSNKNVRLRINGDEVVPGGDSRSSASGSGSASGSMRRPSPGRGTRRSPRSQRK